MQFLYLAAVIVDVNNRREYCFHLGNRTKGFLITNVCREYASTCRPVTLTGPVVNRLYHTCIMDIWNKETVLHDEDNQLIGQSVAVNQTRL